MVWKQGPGIDDPGAVLCEPAQSRGEIVPIKAIKKDLFSLNTPTDNMVQDTGGIQSC